MREIKFRAFIPETGQMIDGKYDTVYVNFQGELMARNQVSGNFEKPQQWILMQYTGLKDKNGKEIYEGDIVDFGEGVNLAIQWAWNSYNFAGKGDWDITNHDPEIEFEVIGNIYENQNLLTLTKDI